MVARQTGRSNIIAYPGYCHVHKTIRPEDVVELLEEHPDIELLLHPGVRLREFLHGQGAGRHPALTTAPSSFPPKECCGTSANRPAKEFAVGTEMGILHRLRKEFPEKGILSRESECRLRVHEDDHARQRHPLAGNDVAAGARARGNCPKGAARDRPHVGTGLNVFGSC